jgi:hypothetical protein
MTGWMEADAQMPASAPVRRRPVWRGLAAFLFGLVLGVGGIFIVAATLLPPTSATSFIDQTAAPALRR